MNTLPQLRASLVAAAERQGQSAARAPRARRRTLRLALVAALVLLALAAVAVAATGVLGTGAPVRPTQPLKPSVGLGVPARGGSRILRASAADPAGGPRWGLRLVHTTRDLLCIQLGRLYHGQLGVLGLDGAFGNDRRFHPLPPDTIGRQPGAVNCQPEGGAVSLEVSGIPESGLMPEEGGLGVISRDRWVSYGLLGPDAVSVTYTDRGRSHTLKVEPGTGAYVIVLRGIETGPNRHGITSGGSGGAERPGGPPLPNPDGAITSITYRLDGHICEDSVKVAAARPCPRPSAAVRAPSLTPSRDLRRPLRVRLRRSALPGGYSATLSFTAPYAVPNALSGYSIASPSPCHGGGTIIDPINRDIVARARVTVPLEAVFANACGDSVLLEVLYSAAHSEPVPGPGSVLVGRVRVAIPR